MLNCKSFFLNLLKIKIYLLQWRTTLPNFNHSDTWVNCWNSIQSCEEETLPKSKWPIWHSSNQTFSASKAALIVTLSISPPNPETLVSTLKSPSLFLSTTTSSSSSSCPLLQHLHFLFNFWPLALFFLFPNPKHLLPTTHGAFTKAKAKQCNTAHGQQHSATQSAINPAMHDLQCLPEHSIRSPPPLSTVANLVVLLLLVVVVVVMVGPSLLRETRGGLLLSSMCAILFFLMNLKKLFYVDQLLQWPWWWWWWWFILLPLSISNVVYHVYKSLFYVCPIIFSHYILLWYTYYINI